MENISIFSTHLQHELKNCKKKIQQDIYCKKKKELHFAFFKRFLQWRPSPSSAHTQHELKNLKGTQQQIYCKKKKELHFAFFRPFLQWRRKSSSEKHERKECNPPPKKKKPNIVRKWKCERHGLIHQHLTPHCSKNLLYPRAASREIAQG
jgi:hypothetical protein